MKKKFKHPTSENLDSPKQEKDFITPYELAALAVMIDKKSPADNPAKMASRELLVDAALDYWIMARTRIELFHREQQDGKRVEETFRSLKAKDYPVKLGKFLRLLLPGRDEAGRMKCFRDWCRDDDPSLYSPSVDMEELTIRYIAKVKEQGFDKETLLQIVPSFLNWLPGYSARILRERASNAGRASAKKRTVKNS